MPYIKALRTITLFIYTMFIGYVSLVDDSSPDNVVPDLNSFGIVNLDKIAHAGAYAIFVCLALSIYKSRKAIITCCLIIALYSLALELMQELVPSRETSLEDFLANIFGIIIGAFLMQLCLKQHSNKTASDKKHLNKQKTS